MTELPYSFGDEEYRWLERACAEYELDEGEMSHAFAIWLDPIAGQLDECAVVLGRQRVGSTRVSTDVWRELRSLQSRRIFANGALEVNPNDPAVALPGRSASASSAAVLRSAHSLVLLGQAFVSTPEFQRFREGPSR